VVAAGPRAAPEGRPRREPAAWGDGGMARGGAGRGRGWQNGAARASGKKRARRRAARPRAAVGGIKIGAVGWRVAKTSKRGGCGRGRAARPEGPRARPRASKNRAAGPAPRQRMAGKSAETG